MEHVDDGDRLEGSIFEWHLEAVVDLDVDATFGAQDDVHARDAFGAGCLAEPLGDHAVSAPDIEKRVYLPDVLGKRGVNLLRSRERDVSVVVLEGEFFQSLDDHGPGGCTSPLAPAQGSRAPPGAAVE